MGCSTGFSATDLKCWNEYLGRLGSYLESLAQSISKFIQVVNWIQSLSLEDWSPHFLTYSQLLEASCIPHVVPFIFESKGVLGIHLVLQISDLSAFKWLMWWDSAYPDNLHILWPTDLGLHTCKIPLQQLD